MKQWCLAALAFSLLGCVTSAIQDGQRSHAYAFDQPSLLATQRVFGVGNAVTLLGEACANYPAALASYEQWQSVNHETLRSMTTQLALHYRIQALPDEQQKRVAEAMHLRTRLALADDALEEACTSLPETLALPWMNLAQRYHATLAEVRDPDYLKPKKPKKTDDREEQTRSE